jgi:bacterial/archaeal transporter family protein
VQTIGILLAFGMALCWAGVGITLQRPSQHMDVFLVNGTRALFGLCFLLLMIFVLDLTHEIRQLSSLQWFYLIFSMLAGGVLGDICYVLGLRSLGMSRSFPIVNSYPLFTIFYSVILLGQRIRVQTMIGAVLVLTGIYCIAQSSRDREESMVGGEADPIAPKQALQGVFLALGSAAAYGFEAIIIAIGVSGVNGIAAATVRVPVMIFFAFSVATARGALRERRGVDIPTMALLALAGLLGALGGSMWVASIQAIGPSQAAIIGSTAPLFAVPMSIVLLRERPTRWTLLGTLLAVGGVILVI